ncbi:MAG: hypothetical protein ABL962_05760 [Fimbriimonadaceae bacterium]
MYKPSRRQFLATCGATLIAPSILVEEPLITPADFDFLRELAKSTIVSATKSESVPYLGHAVITPGGDYPAFWIRDFSMAAGCGLISSRILHNHIRLIAKSQNRPSERRLGERALIPAHAIPDHVNYDGGAVFYPGTYSAGDDQGGEPYGVLPPVDDHYEFVHLAYLLWKAANSKDFLKEQIGGLELFDLLNLAMDCPATDPTTGLVITEAKTRAVGFGFCDGVYLTGSLLFASLLRYRALGEMVAMLGQSGQYASERRRIEEHLVPVFKNEGWLKAATGVGQQPDVWGTIFALYMGVVKGEERRRLLHTVAEATRKGTITYCGAVRHVPTDHDFSASSAWEQTAGIPLNRYQNGAYWHVPSGWLAKILWETNKGLARQVVREMIAHFREEASKGAPWECLHPTKDYRQNPVYMASVTLPLEALSKNRGNLARAL